MPRAEIYIFTENWIQLNISVTYIFIISHDYWIAIVMLIYYLSKQVSGGVCEIFLLAYILNPLSDSEVMSYVELITEKSFFKPMNTKKL